MNVRLQATEAERRKGSEALAAVQRQAAEQRSEHAKTAEGLKAALGSLEQRFAALQTQTAAAESQLHTAKASLGTPSAPSGPCTSLWVLQVMLATAGLVSACPISACKTGSAEPNCYCHEPVHCQSLSCRMLLYVLV